MLMLNAPATAKRAEDAIEEVKIEVKIEVKKGSIYDSTYGLSIFWGYGSKDPALLVG